MGRIKVDTGLLPAKLQYFCYFGGIGALWPYIPVLCRQYGIPPQALGITLGLSVLGILFFVLLFPTLKRYFRTKSLLSILVLVSILIYGALGLLQHKLQTPEKALLQRPVGLSCSSEDKSLYLRHCNSQQRNCFQSLNTEKYFEGEDGTDNEWRFVKDNLKDKSYFEFCDARCSVDTPNWDVCDLFEDPKTCEEGRHVEYMGNETFLRFEMRIQVAKIRRNDTCTILPLQSVAFDGRRLWSSCPFPSKGGSGDVTVLERCFLDCTRNKQLNLALETGAVTTVDSGDICFWVLLTLSGLGVFTICAGAFLTDWLCFETFAGTRRANELWGVQRCWGLVGWGLFALASRYAIDWYSEEKPVKDFTPAFYLASGLFGTSLGVIMFWKVKERRLDKDLAMAPVFKVMISKPKNLLLTFACILVGMCYGLQTNFMLWFVEEIVKNNKEINPDSCELLEGIKLAQGLFTWLECWVQIPIFYFAGRIIPSVNSAHFSSGTLLFLGLSFLSITLVEHPWGFLSSAVLSGLSHGLFFLAVKRRILTVSRIERDSQYPGIYLIPIITFVGIGFGAGSLTSGLFWENESGQLVFQVFGGIALGAALFHFIFGMVLIPRHSQEDERLSSSVDLEEEEPESEKMINGVNNFRKLSKAETVRSSSTAVDLGEASTTSSMNKLKLLLWKNFKIQTRHKVQTIVEIVIPLVFTIALAMIRVIIPVDKVTEPTLFTPFELKGNVPTVMKTLTNELYYSPNNNPYVDEIMSGIRKEYFEAPGLSYAFRGFANEEKLRKSYEKSMEGYSGQSGTTAFNATSKVLAGIIFPAQLSKNKTHKIIEYQIRLPAFQRFEFELVSERFTFKPSWFTESIYPLFRLPGPRSKSNEGGFPGYFAEGFLYLQNAIDSTLTKLLIKPEQLPEYESYNIKMQRFPFPAYTNDNFIFASQFWMAFFLVMSFVYPAMNITKMIVHEKECRLKEFMKIMGLPNWLHWTAWFIKTFLHILVTLLCLTILMKIRFQGGLAILTEANSMLLFVLFVFHAFSLIGFCFFMSTLYSCANSAATATGFVWLMFFLPYSFVFPRINTLSRTAKYMTSFLLANSPLTYACYIMSTFEGTGSGVQWDNITQGVSPDDTFCVLDCIIMMTVNALTYAFAAFYIEVVFPGKYGVPLPWYYLFTKWYWTGGVLIDKQKRAPFLSKNRAKSTCFETDPTHLRVGIDIKGLTKAFGKKTAVRDLSIKLFENQITALLGHNGAGKTTTMSMLTGILTPTRGTAVVNEHDICKDMRAVRASLGLCPQYNVLFDELTVEEHLLFYSLLKGYRREEADVEVERMLVALGFESKRDAQAHTLSGGMKRKLSVGIAFCAGSKAVLLDEPTSGMDVGARRSTWDLIQTEKMGRTVILSTHFMEEADLLGDRIAIMADGEVKCCGSSLFLKKRYGGDYRLIVVKDPDCVVGSVTQVLRTKLPAIEVGADVGAELSYSLPAEHSAEFPSLFEELENRKDELGIASYGVGSTTMEEVFMRVGAETSVVHQVPQTPFSMHTIKSNYSSLKSQIERNSTTKDHLLPEERKLEKPPLMLDGPRNHGSKLMIQQFGAVVRKKLLYVLRNRNLALLQIGIPNIFMIMIILTIKTLPGLETPKPHRVTLEHYQMLGDTITAMSCDRSQKVCKGYADFVSGKKFNTENVGGSTFLVFILDKAREDVAKTNSRYIVGFEQTSKSPLSRQATELTAFFNNQPLHSPPLALNFLSNGILRGFGVKTELSAVNHPFDYNAIDRMKQTASFFTPGFFVGWVSAIGLAFQAASFILFPVQERVSGAKHLQFVSGLKYPIYWAASTVVDMFNYMIPCGIMISLLVLSGMKEFQSTDVVLSYLALSLLHAWAMVPLKYLFSFAFTIPASGYARMTVLHASTGLISMLVVIILNVPEFDMDDLTDSLHNIFMVVPNYAMGMGIVQITSQKDLKEFCGSFDLGSFCLQSPDFVCCTKYQESFYAWEPFGIGKNLLALFLYGVFALLGIVLIESRIVHKLIAIFEFTNDWEMVDSNVEEEPLDEDVAKEAQRINSQTLSRLSKQDNLILRNFTKIYDGKLTAVDKLTLGVRRGETFGLLGVNGAGKTTTFKMLTGDIPVTAGDAYLCRHSVRKSLAQVYENLGYCPQFDAMIEELTGRETIRMFANIKGIQGKHINKIVNNLGESLLFTQHLDKQVGEYSGGNKRKLSTALAMLGSPPIVFLDEPTTGMDPVARRHVWNAVSRLKELGTSVLITSHNMEECEALCSRLAIMVNGQFQCLGAPQHLKNKFGEGYTIVAQLSYSGTIGSTPIAGMEESSDVVDVKPWELELKGLKYYIEAEFPDCELKDTHPGFVQYYVPGTSVKWAKLFAVMERAKDQFNLEAYSVGQTSLEQVFFNFTKLQRSIEE